ncbi:uncharacterized protein LOC144621204 [Crassostrea virginica]
MATIITLSNVHHFLVQVMLIFTLHNSTFVRCACLEDVLSLTNGTNPCPFDKKSIKSMFLVDQQNCLSNCSAYFTDPYYTGWNKNTVYEINYISILFTKTQYLFGWSVTCAGPSYSKFSLSLLCEGKYFYERGIGESCVEPAQCQAVNPDSTCNFPNGKCSCQEGYLWNSTTCIEARGLDGNCTESKQCQEINVDSTCNTVRSKCECQQGFIQHFNSCLPARKLGESCANPLQCSVTSQNSTCNDTSNVCECKEGYLEVFNTCTIGRLVLDEICKGYLQSERRGHDKKDIENACSTLIYNPSRET